MKARRFMQNHGWGLFIALLAAGVWWSARTEIDAERVRDERADAERRQAWDEIKQLARENEARASAERRAFWTEALRRLDAGMPVTRPAAVRVTHPPPPAP